MKLPRDFREMLEEFGREGVEYAIVGGYAFAFHARPRATKDLDLFLEGSAPNLERVSRALAQYGAPSNVVSEMRRLGETEVVFLGRPPLRIDLMRKVDGVDATTLLRNAVPATWDGLPVKIIGLDDLIANKRAAGRLQDLADVEQLERVRTKLGSRK